MLEVSYHKHQYLQFLRLLERVSFLFKSASFLSLLLTFVSSTLIFVLPNFIINQLIDINIFNTKIITLFVSFKDSIHLINILTINLHSQQYFPLSKYSSLRRVFIVPDIKGTVFPGIMRPRI
jgi:hypothetical protein